jgi:hypothetical protein
VGDFAKTVAEHKHDVIRFSLPSGVSHRDTGLLLYFLLLKPSVHREGFRQSRGFACSLGLEPALDLETDSCCKARRAAS